MKAYDFDKAYIEAWKHHEANQKKTLEEASAAELLEAMEAKFREME